MVMTSADAYEDYYGVLLWSLSLVYLSLGVVTSMLLW